MLESNLSDKNLAPSALQPVMSTERIQAMDVLRGFAIFGVVIAYAVWSLGTPPPDTYTTSDQIADLILAAFIDSKFYTLLSFLFGLGFSIQLARARGRGANVVPVYIRRLVGMMLFGFAHALLLRNGDILVPYATIGFVLLLLRNASNRSLLGAGLVGAFLPFIARAVWEMIGVPFPDRPDTEGVSLIASNFAWVKYWYATAVTVWPGFLPMFVLGLYVGRQQGFVSRRGYRKGLRSLVVFGLVIGATLFVGRFALIAMIDPAQGPTVFVNMLFGLTWQIHAWGFAAFYAAAILLLLQRRRFQSVFEPLAKVGRMSLTNYLLQSMIIVPICVAFDLFDKVTPGLGLALAFIVAIIQIPLSVVWLRYFRFGPAEWVLRSITYWELQPMRRDVAGPISQAAVAAAD